MLMKILGPKMKAGRIRFGSNEELHQQTDVAVINGEERRLQFYGHLLRTDRDSWREESSCSQTKKKTEP